MFFCCCSLRNAVQSTLDGSGSAAGLLLLVLADRISTKMQRQVQDMLIHHLPFRGKPRDLFPSHSPPNLDIAGQRLARAMLESLHRLFVQGIGLVYLVKMC